MTTENLEIVMDILAVTLSAFTVVRMAPLLRVREQQMTSGSFLFAMVSLMLSYAYWLAYSLIRPDMRMPLAANMIGECAVFLLLSVTLESVFRVDRVPARSQIACALLFASSSVTLWIAWTGEWIQDIVGGIAYSYFLCVCVRALVQADALAKIEWIGLGIACALIIAIWTVWFYVPEDLLGMTNCFGYAVIYAVTAYLLFKTFHAVRRNTAPDRQLALAVFSHAWCMGAMYMTSGYYYNAAMFLCLLTLPLMLAAVSGEVKRA